jgi:TonB family protein
VPIPNLDNPLGSVMEPPEELRVDVTTDTGPSIPPDRLGRRLAWGLLASLLVNLALWQIASQVVRNHILMPPRPLTFRLVVLPRPPKPKPHKKIVHHIIKPKPKPPVKIKPIVKVKPVVTHRPIPHPVRRPKSAPPAAHHHVLTSKGPTPSAHTALPGGHAALGIPIAHQNAGQGSDNNVALPPPQTKPQPAPPAPQPKPQPVPPAPKSAPPPAPKPQPPPQPSGPTQDAQPSHQTLPDIPSDLTDTDYSSSVQVKVEVAADGSFHVSLLTSSGNMEVDQRVLEALKKWQWKPALQDGQPVGSAQRFRFNFQVQ